nr:retrovirus-related Pol polyprotein from transposon TNT 1-94 [Tanacetum cinerariifolium]
MMYNSQETTKLDLKSKKCLFLKHAKGVKGYRLWDPTTHKVVVNRDVVFIEDKIQENEEGGSTTKETTSIQMENEFRSNDSSEAVPQYELNETTESQAPTTHTKEGETSTLQKALNNPDVSFCKEAMQEEIQALYRNKTWELVPLPGGYAQKEGIDFNKIFSLMIRMKTILGSSAMCATYDLHLELVDVKTAFLHGNIEEEIYMLQPEGYKQKGKENLVYRDDGDVSSTVCMSGGMFNVRDDLYKTRHCTCSGSSESSVVAMSTKEAEYVAAAQASKEAVWLKMLLEELGKDNGVKINLASIESSSGRLLPIIFDYGFDMWRIGRLLLIKVCGLSFISFHIHELYVQAMNNNKILMLGLQWSMLEILLMCLGTRNLALRNLAGEHKSIAISDDELSTYYIPEVHRACQPCSSSAHHSGISSSEERPGHYVFMSEHISRLYQGIDEHK